MALPSIDLDDLGYQQLLEILRSHLPGEQWSDHNPSDPGITLLELLAWLGEMDLYRMNRVPASHREKFLKLLVEPPVPVSLTATLAVVPPRAPPPGPPREAPPLTLPPGLRLATDYRNGRRYVFESHAAGILRRPPSALEQTGDIPLRAVRQLQDVLLGHSDGTPNQTFAIPDGPVLLDANPPAGLDPNPRVRVGVDLWELRSFLLTGDSHATSKHFAVEEFEGQVRFGDGVFGAIPPKDQPITLVACQVLEGRAALTAAGGLKHVLNPEIVTDLGAGERLEIVANTDAQGGDNFHPMAERMRRGLEEFRRPTRLITAADFERVILDDFNEYQRDFNAALDRDEQQVRRVVTLMNRQPPLATTATSPGHVTLMILPSFDEAAFEGLSLGDKAAAITPSPGLQSRLLAFLEPRRLITTRLHVVAPELKPVSARLVVVVSGERNAPDRAQAIERALRDFLSLTHGHYGTGWPLGTSVRRSQLYRVVEDVAGVDHVDSLTLQDATEEGDVEIGARQLPVWDNLVVLVRRG
jgi:hypothetical protein